MGTDRNEQIVQPQKGTGCTLYAIYIHNLHIFWMHYRIVKPNYPILKTITAIISLPE